MHSKNGFALEKTKAVVLMLEQKNRKISVKLYENVVKTSKEPLKIRLKTALQWEKRSYYLNGGVKI